MNHGIMQPRPSQMQRADFMARFGGVCEHSPWVAERVYDRGLRRHHDALEQLGAAFRSEILGADRSLQLALLRAHPRLACEQRDLTPESGGEQAGAGLDACSREEFAAFQALNAAYDERFGFPFIIAVRGRDRRQILREFRMRLARDAETEFRAALEQVCRIAHLRLEALSHG